MKLRRTGYEKGLFFCIFGEANISPYGAGKLAALSLQSLEKLFTFRISGYYAGGGVFRLRPRVEQPPYTGKFNEVVLTSTGIGFRYALGPTSA